MRPDPRRVHLQAAIDGDKEINLTASAPDGVPTRPEQRERRASESERKRGEMRAALARWDFEFISYAGDDDIFSTIQPPYSLLKMSSSPLHRQHLRPHPPELRA